MENKKKTKTKSGKTEKNKTKILYTYILHKFNSVNLMLESGTKITQHTLSKKQYFHR